jgi:sugar (pentulose or hexulose) kinase
VQEPDASKKSLYDAKYERYTKVIAALDAVWKDLG